MSKAKDINPDILDVIKYYGLSTKKQIYWLCSCDCGNKVYVKTTDLTHGIKKSCGCLQLISGHSNYKYGCRTNRLYTIWKGMKARCLNINDKYYYLYGGKGISICKEWINDFASFQLWALNNGYADNLSIDRIDSNGNYEPNNCRWATSFEQNNNKKIIVILQLTVKQKHWQNGVEYITQTEKKLNII